MKFNLKTTAYLYKGEEVKELQELGFEFKKSDMKDKFYIKDKLVEIEVTSLEELISFIKKYGQIILDENSIEIYNDYRE